jgi:hypothetical protein
MRFLDIDDDSMVLVASFIHPREEGRLRISIREAHIRLRTFSLLPQDCIPFITFPCLISLLYPAPAWESDWSNARSTASTLALNNVQGTWLHEDGRSKILVNGRLVMFYHMGLDGRAVRYGATATMSFNRDEESFKLRFGSDDTVAIVGVHERPDVIRWTYGTGNLRQTNLHNDHLSRTWTRPLKETQTRDRLVRFSEDCLEDLRNLHLMAMRREVSPESWAKLTPSLCLGGTVVQTIPRDCGRLWDAVLSCRIGIKFNALRFGRLKPPVWRHAVEQRRLAEDTWVQSKHNLIDSVSTISLGPCIAVDMNNYELDIEVHIGLPVNNSEIWWGGPWTEVAYNEHKAVSFPVFAHTSELCGSYSIEGDVAFAVSSQRDAPFLDPITADQVSPRTIFLTATCRRKSDSAIVCLVSFLEASDFVFSPWDGVNRCVVPFSFHMDFPAIVSGGVRRRASFEAWACLNKTSFPGSFAVDEVTISLRDTQSDGLAVPVRSTDEFLALLEQTGQWTSLKYTSGV